VGTGYVPIRSDAASQASMKRFYAKYPTLRAAYTEISTGKVDTATAGPLLGCYYTVSNDLVTAEDSLFSNSYPSPASVLSTAAAKTTKRHQVVQLESLTSAPTERVAGGTAAPRRRLGRHAPSVPDLLARRVAFQPGSFAPRRTRVREIGGAPPRRGPVR